MSAATRRALLGGAAVLAVPAAVGADQIVNLANCSASHPDAELLALEREAVPLIPEYADAVAAFLSVPDDLPEPERLAELERWGDLETAVSDRLFQLAEAADGLRPVTLAGLAAKARLVRWQMLADHGDGAELQPGTPAMACAVGLCDDLLAMGRTDA